MAASVRKPGFRCRQSRPHRGNGVCVRAVFLAVPYSRGCDGIPHPTRVPSAVRPHHCAEKSTDRPGSGHVPGRAARASKRLPTRPARLLAQCAVRGGARILHGHHAFAGNRRAAGRLTRECAFNGRVTCCRRRRARTMAIQEPAPQRGGRLPHRLPVRDHVVSAAAVFAPALRSLAGRHLIRRLTAQPSCS